MDYKSFTFPKGWLKHLDELEDWNNHTERLIEIAKECEKQAGEGSYDAHELRSIRECLEDNLHEHTVRGGLTKDLMTIRHGLVLYLRERIGFTFGPEVLKKIRP